MHIILQLFPSLNSLSIMATIAMNLVRGEKKQMQHVNMSSFGAIESGFEAFNLAMCLLETGTKRQNPFYL